MCVTLNINFVLLWCGLVLNHLILPQWLDYLNCLLLLITAVIAIHHLHYQWKNSINNKNYYRICELMKISNALFCDDLSELEDKVVLGHGLFLSLQPVPALHHLGLQDLHLPYVHVHVHVVPGDIPHK